MKFQVVVLLLGLLTCQSNAANMSGSVENALTIFTSTAEVLARDIKNGMKVKLDLTRSELLKAIEELKIDKSVEAGSTKDTCIEEVKIKINAVTYDPLDSCVDNALSKMKTDISQYIANLKIQMVDLDKVFDCISVNDPWACITLIINNLSTLKIIGDILTKSLEEMINIITTLIRTVAECEQEAAGRASLKYASLALDVARCF